MRYPSWDGSPTEWAIIAHTFGEARDICLEGPSGLLEVLRRRGLIEDHDFALNRGAMIVEFASGQKVYVMAAKDKDVGRGYNLAGAWLDEFGKWRYADIIWTESLAPALRIGQHPRAVVTTTPKPTVKQLQRWADRADGSVFITRGSTFDNARHLSKTALAELEAVYGGTRIGRQELHGELIAEVEGALWTARSIEANRISPDDWDWHHPEASLRRWLDMAPTTGHTRNWKTAVAVDPPGETAECGIVVAQAPERARYGIDHCAILSDETIIGRPEEWGMKVIAAYRAWDCAAVYVEKNQGQDMVRSTIHAIDPTVPVTKINATASKGARAEPVSVLYERNLVHHIGFLPKLEDQLLTWAPDDARSPDRLDALVHVVNHLIPEGSRVGRLVPMARRTIPGLR
jgi:phage terminase large subunit-like protein